MKYSDSKQDASFFDSILKNFLEVYLNDKENTNRFFKLVYNMDISKGNLSKLIENKLDEKSRNYWEGKIKQIKKSNPNWFWNEFNFEDFYKQLSFEKITKDDLIKKIQKLLISKVNITTGNESIYIHGLFFNVFQLALTKSSINLKQFNVLIQNIRDEIAKGFYNPALNWVNKISFQNINEDISDSFFEGKKVTPYHIVKELPVRRYQLEKIIEDSINNNYITVIKSSSGQGKSTLAWQVAYNLKDGYSIYKLNWCRETKELGNIVEYFKSRLKIGEKVLILIDNLNIDFKEWNKLSQLFYEQLKINYKLLLTTREDDWYVYSGDHSSLYGMKIINLAMNENEAKSIFYALKSKDKLHPSITNWQSSWEQVKDKGLLIEFVYLITHGEMLEDRLNYQIKSIQKDSNRLVKYKILRYISLADVLGIKLKGNKLVQVLNKKHYKDCDINNAINSIENEFFIKVSPNNDYIEGLHPIRSKHILNILNKYEPIVSTLNELLEIVDDFYIAQLCSKIPQYIEEDKDEFYQKFAFNIYKKPYGFIVNALEGIYSGTVLNYFNSYKEFFDDANNKGGLYLLATDISPWNSVEKLGTEVKTLKNLCKIEMENNNVKYLYEISKKIPTLDIDNSDIYIAAYYIYQQFKDKMLKRKRDKFATFANWLYRLDKNFNLISNLDLYQIWKEREKWNDDELALLFYLFYTIDKDSYYNFINVNKKEIFSYLKTITDSLNIYENEKDIHIVYALSLNDMNKANELSVKRIKKVCKFLPIYNKYHTNTIKPKIDIVNSITKGLPDESHKAMPINNIKLSFNVDMNSIWIKSIMCQYEFSSIYEWQEYWLKIRKQILKFINLNIKFLENTLRGKPTSKIIINELHELSGKITNSLIKHVSAPREDRPFEQDVNLAELTKKMKLKYFPSIRNYINQFVYIIKRDKENNLCNLALINLKTAKNELIQMHENFKIIEQMTSKYFDTQALKMNELRSIQKLICLNEYYLEHEPNMYYDYVFVEKWIKENDKQRLEKVHNLIDSIIENTSLDIIKPKYIVNERLLKLLVIGIRNFDFKDENKVVELFTYLCILKDTDVDFIIIVSVNDNSEVFPIGLRSSREFLMKLYQSIENNTDYLNDIIKPLPLEITEEYLNAIDEKKLNISSPKIVVDERVESVLYLFWKISIYRKYFQMDIDMERDYYINQERIIKEKIENLLNGEIKYKHELLAIKEDIFKNNYFFDDNEFNKWYSRIIRDVEKYLF